jgi:predicted anti-sigma-YlaC factor YlaD
MKCKRIRELLLTDYMDGGVDSSLRGEFDRHIAACQACRNYKLSIDSRLSPLFKESEVVPPADEIWNGIESAIYQKQQIKDTNIFSISPLLRKSIFAFTTAAALVVVMISIKVADNNRRASVNSFLMEESNFLYSLSNYNGSDTFNNIDFGTTIEEWFL